MIFLLLFAPAPEYQYYYLWLHYEEKTLTKQQIKEICIPIEIYDCYTVNPSQYLIRIKKVSLTSQEVRNALMKSKKISNTYRIKANPEEDKWFYKELP